MNIFEQPKNPYDIVAWSNFYEQNPAWKRSVGAEGDNSSEGSSGEGAGSNADEIDVNSDAFKSAVAAAVGQRESGLKNKTNELLEKLDEAKKKAAAFDGIDPDAVKKMMSSFNQSEEAKLIAEGKFDEVLNKRLERSKAEMDDRISASEKSLVEAKESGALFKSKYESKMMGDIFRDSASKSKALPGAYDDILRRAEDVFKLNELGEPEARDANGDLRKTEDGMSLTPDRFIEQLKTSSPHYWPASVSSGALGADGKPIIPSDGSKLHAIANSGQFSMDDYKAERDKSGGKDRYKKQ